MIGQPLRPLLVFGTRPEAIKMAPIIRACHQRAEEVQGTVCITGQHREMLQQVLDYFGIRPDLDLALMQPNQSLSSLTARCICELDRVLTESRPDCIVVQGDTTTVMGASVAAFYHGVPIVHVEAGLRTGNLQAPWPEEFNRRVTSLVAGLHCAPTQRAATNLLGEGLSPDSIHITGNTVVDALLWSTARERGTSAPWGSKHAYLGDRRMVLITGHRRENFGDGFKAICAAIAELATRFPDVQVVYPVHWNPNVRTPVHTILKASANVHLLEPAPYPEFVWLMDRSYIILSDSGGVQEEAPSLKKPVLVMRDTTERPEGVEAGAVELVGTDAPRIVARVSALLQDSNDYRRHQIDHNPYGDGHAAERIVDLMIQRAWTGKGGRTRYSNES